MAKGRSEQLVRLLFAAGLVWCIFVGLWTWFAPLPYSGYGRGGATIRFRSFSEVSAYGPLPLIVPVLIAVWAARAAWQGRRRGMVTSTVVMGLFSFISGFSIGGSYLPAAGLFIWGLVAAVDDGAFEAPEGQPSNTPLQPTSGGQSGVE